MKKYFLVLLLMLVGQLAGVFRPALAAAPPALTVPPGLSIAEIKVTGNEFLRLQNNSSSAIDDLSRYWLYVFNGTNPLAAGVSSSTQQLPATSLAAGQTILLSSNGGSTCGAAAADKLSVSFRDSGGFLEIVHTDLDSNGKLVQTGGDAVAWDTGSLAPNMISDVPTSSDDKTDYAAYRYQSAVTPPAYDWQAAQIDSTNPCQLDVIAGGTSSSGPVNTGNQLLPGTPPPATIVSLAASSSPSGSLPVADLGLKAPQITELLPNPAKPATDATGEFIELYNSNKTAFDLTGFKLQTGTTTKHSYVFPAGTQLPAGGFGAFYSADTNLSLSNSGGQAALLDPLGNVISQTDTYSSAKDGQAWALANGKWYWTAKPTPDAANVIVQTSASAKPAATPGSAAVKGASTTTAGLADTAAQQVVAPLHAWILAAIGGLALLYACYEYRHDLANQVYRLRRYRTSRRTAG